LAKGFDVRVADQHLSLRVYRHQSSGVAQADGPELIAVGEAAIANLGW
jgi:hypothetical protein